MNARAYALLAEVTYRCPLHCPYCSNPVEYPAGEELRTEEWKRVLREAGSLGVLHVGFSGGEPLARKDLAALIAEARAAGLYTNLLSSGLGLSEARARELREAGLDSFQLSFQADTAGLADSIAGATAHERKLAVAELVRACGFPLTVNVVLHRGNIDQLVPLVALAEEVGATRLELASTQYYGWAFRNRAQLLPTRTQVEQARLAAEREQQRLRGRMEINYIVPDYYEDRPKPCMQGWGRRYLTVNPVGEVLPCPTAFSIPGLRFENVRQRSLQWIWRESESFARFRGTEWMQEPCASCPRREIDFGGCRCQAALIAGAAEETDPVCALSPKRVRVDAVLAELPAEAGSWEPRRNPDYAAPAVTGSPSENRLSS